MRITRKAAVQVHPVPDHIVDPVGPFPSSLFKEPEIVDNYAPQYSEDGSDFQLGSTAQNNFKPVKTLRCGSCLARVPENETSEHVCGDVDGGV
jgi:hypothetical protein